MTANDLPLTREDPHGRTAKTATILTRVFVGYNGGLAGARLCHLIDTWTVHRSNLALVVEVSNIQRCIVP